MGLVFDFQWLYQMVILTGKIGVSLQLKIQCCTANSCNIAMTYTTLLLHYL